MLIKEPIQMKKKTDDRKCVYTQGMLEKLAQPKCNQNLVRYRELTSLSTLESREHLKSKASF